MSGVNEGQKNAMGDIMAAMNRAMGEPVAAGRTAHTSAAGFEAGSDDAKKKAMGDILRMFKSATDNIREDAQHDEALMEALQTTRTETGVRISEWEIVISEQEGRTGKFYNVIREDIEIATDLRLYEAALLLTRELNRGSSITSAKVREILRLEEEFAKNLEDAARFGRIAKNSEGQKRVIAEARYSDARSKAVAAKEQIKSVR